LWELLSLHPATARREQLWEDGLLSEADQLVAYANRVGKGWSPEAQAAEQRLLLRYLGSGLTSFLVAQSGGKRVVTKTPSVRNLGLFFELFPDATLLLVVRDGRSVAESTVRSFGSTYAAATRAWASGAQTVLDFVNTHPAGRYRVVQYESLLTDLERELDLIFALCGLDPNEYDYGAARQLPLLGSSTDRGSGGGVHWTPVSRPDDFHGFKRWDGWSERQHQQFNLAAGHYLVSFGYEMEPVPRPGAVTRAVHLVSNMRLWLNEHKPFRSFAWRLSRMRRRRRDRDRSK
jgi:hypothetical protein